LKQKEKEWIRKENNWIEEEVAFRREIVALEKQRKEGNSSDPANKKKQTKKKESMQPNVKDQQEIDSEQEFRVLVLLANIARELTKVEWENMSYIPKESHPDSAIKMFRWLEETSKISIVDLKLLEELLIQHDRPDLVNKFISPYQLWNAKK